jgi:TMEM175 potassium channel family protein
LEYANSWVMRINLGLLMAVAFLPFPTKLLAESIHDRDAEQAAVIFYGATLLVISLLHSALWGVIRRERDLLKPDVSKREINALVVATTPSLGFYVGVIVLAIFAPRVAAFGYLVIGIVAVFRAHGDQGTPPEIAEPT